LCVFCGFFRPQTLGGRQGNFRFCMMCGRSLLQYAAQSRRQSTSPPPAGAGAPSVLPSVTAGEAAVADASGSVRPVTPRAALGGAGFDGGGGGGELTRVSVLLAAPGAYVARCDSPKAYLELNRELASATEGGHLTGFTLSRHDNYLQPALELGAKAVIGPGCVVGYGARLGDRASVKRSVLGRRVRLAAAVKIVNSVLHEEAALEEGAAVTGCVIGRGATVGAKANLRDCHVAPGAVVAAGSEHRNETLH
jgi:translation initiation factor eIF-2B subunit gamma